MDVDLKTDTKSAERFAKFVVPTAKRSLTVVRGAGSYLWDDSGKRYLDLGGGVAVNSLGHAHPAIQATLTCQSANLIHCSNYFYHEDQGKLAERVVELTGPGKVFNCNSGAEANEALIKLSRKWGQESGRYEIITTINSFHGRTMAGLSATGQEKTKAGFAPYVPGFVHVPFNDLQATEAAITPKTVAILIEGVQGEGGIFPATPEYLLGLRELANKHHLLLMMDAVQCGCFRTGTWQSYERILWDTPGRESFHFDGISMAKSMGGGFPLGCVWIREPFQDVLGLGSHGTTYGGSPLACAVALTVLDVIKNEKLDANIWARGEQLRAGLEKLIAGGKHLITEVRGFGGMVGMIVEGDPAAVVVKLTEAGLILIPAANHAVRFLPPLNVSREEIVEALAIVEQTLRR